MLISHNPTMLLAVLPTCQTISVFEINPWGDDNIPPGMDQYPPLNASCGDRLEFVWPADDSHGVFRLYNNVSGLSECSTGVAASSACVWRFRL